MSGVHDLNFIFYIIFWGIFLARTFLNLDFLSGFLSAINFLNQSWIKIILIIWVESKKNTITISKFLKLNFDVVYK